MSKLTPTINFAVRPLMKVKCWLHTHLQIKFLKFASLIKAK